MSAKKLIQCAISSHGYELHITDPDSPNEKMILDVDAEWNGEVGKQAFSIARAFRAVGVEAEVSDEIITV